MNGLDGIIALCALLGCFGILIGAVNEERKISQEVNYSLNAKTNAITCGAVIDSMFSNSANEHNGTLDCKIEGNVVSGASNSKTKTFLTITKAKKNTQIEVEILEHYTN
ncbi:MAG: hypothetical protein WCW13_04255 [archaeon]|jgi:hypothetical protein